MLKGKKISLEAKTVVNDVEICKYVAIIPEDSSGVTFLTQMIDKDACKEHRDIVREDRADFEDWAYAIQEQNTGDINVGLEIEE